MNTLLKVGKLAVTKLAQDMKTGRSIDVFYIENCYLLNRVSEVSSPASYNYDYTLYTFFNLHCECEILYV